ncbi:AAA family ATPase [Aliamphritea spongicola]|nr:AAA family ATPase [Aliamphritea spongicola]
MNQQVPAIETEHWLVQLLTLKDTHLLQLISAQNLDQEKLLGELNARINALPKGSEGQPTLSKNISDLIESAWLMASVDYGHQQILSLHLVLAMLQTDHFGVKKLALKSLETVSLEALQSQISKLTTAAPAGGSAPAAAGGAPAAGGALDKYTVNLTAQARDGQIDPISGRNDEVRQAIDVLCRKRQNNPILVGEPGVGKTAVVEGLALRIVAGEVPTALQGVELHSLDLGLLQAGASIKGEFENRLKDVISEVKNSAIPIIMFIDEAHTLIGAGGAEGQNDAANLLKPALARGEFKSLAATTWAEYKKYFEKDPALTRRFQVVKIAEPSAEDAIQMLRGIGESLSEHHGVFIREEAIEAAVNLSIRYLPSRQLPDKAISLLDTACARIALTQNAKPETIEYLEQQIRYLNNERSAKQTEQAVFTTGADSIEALNGQIAEMNAELEALQTRWEQELELVEQIRTIKSEIQTAYSEDHVSAEQQQQMLQLMDQLEALQGDDPLVVPLVNQQVISSVISSWTGIPVGNMLRDEVAKLLSMEDDLHKRVIGQETAINELAKSIRISVPA